MLLRRVLINTTAAQMSEMSQRKKKPAYLGHFKRLINWYLRLKCTRIVAVPAVALNYSRVLPLCRCLLASSEFTGEGIVPPDVTQSENRPRHQKLTNRM